MNQVYCFILILRIALYNSDKFTYKFGSVWISDDILIMP